MTRQNRTLGFVVLFSIGILGVLLWGAGVFQSDTRPEASQSSAESGGGEGMPSPESMGDPADGDAEDPAAVQLREDQKAFAFIFSDLSQCLGFKPTNLAVPGSVSIETLLTLLQTDLGPPIRQEDRWMSWHLRNREGRERRLRLEVTESDDGRMNRELHYFAVDREGLPIPLEIEPERAQNPSDEALNQMLREGDVFFKEKAGTVLFPNMERLDYIEVDGMLAEIELVKAESIFRCVNLKSREACTCLK